VPAHLGYLEEGLIWCQLTRVDVEEGLIWCQLTRDDVEQWLLNESVVVVGGISH